MPDNLVLRLGAYDFEHNDISGHLFVQIRIEDPEFTCTGVVRIFNSPCINHSGARSSQSRLSVTTLPKDKEWVKRRYTIWYLVTSRKLTESENKLPVHVIGEKGRKVRKEKLRKHLTDQMYVMIRCWTNQRHEVSKSSHDRKL